LKAAVERYAPWLAAAVLIAGIAAFAVTRHSGPGSTPAPPHRAAPFAAAERNVAHEFVETAVARMQLERAWEIAAPELKQGMSLDRWKTGTIPVVPYPVDQAHPIYHVLNSFTDTARIQVTFTPRVGSKVRAATFALDLRNVDGRWLVSAWQPTSTVVPHKGT
jgi:hypothetical protein